MSTLIKKINIAISVEGQKRCLNNAGGENAWSATKKTGTWEKAKGKFHDGTDIATFQGAKGEEIIGQYLNLSRIDQKTDKPDKFDFSHPIDGKKIEVKTLTPGWNTCLLQVQKLISKKQKFEWLNAKNPESKQGLVAHYYVFCIADASKENWNGEILGYITRDEILKSYSRLYPAKRRNAGGLPEWMNVEIPYTALKSIEEFKLGCTKASTTEESKTCE